MEKGWYNPGPAATGEASGGERGAAFDSKPPLIRNLLRFETPSSAPSYPSPSNPSPSISLVSGFSATLDPR